MLISSLRLSRPVSLAIFLVAVVVLSIYAFSTTTTGRTQFDWLLGHDAAYPPDLPREYLPRHPDSDWCQERFGLPFLEDLRAAEAEYCVPESPSYMSCFWSRTADNRNDALCYATDVKFNSKEHKFVLGCDMKDQPPQDSEGNTMPGFPDGLPAYWYNTGPAFVAAERLAVLPLDDVSDYQAWATEAGYMPSRINVLVKREGAQNPWHSMMELMSMMMSLDALRLPGANQSRPILAEDYGDKAQVVLLDDHEDGPYLDLWRSLARMPVRRIADLHDDEPLSDVVIPLAGASNTLWQGDWVDLDCRDGATLRAFAHRVLGFYKTLDPPPGLDVVSVTLIRRTNTRRLVDEERHVEALRARIPHMALEVVEFESMPFARQLEVVRRTDLLVGVHGAGLTHAMFLRPGAAVLEIQPEGFDHKGFRNLAQMLGLEYSVTHADLQEDSKGGDDRWQMEAVRMEEDKLVDLVGTGVRSLYTRGGREYNAAS